ncbi:MAG: DEAD/DEAH box helicase family protein [Candidatus Shapirobacteria bacterium]|nr:DEAD/DEAH box helicase family protein [Candidatus Shapirobacteria bacterium]
MANEAYSRVIIDQKLKEAGWDITDSNQVIFEDHGVAGRADYLLKDKIGRPIALIEAKSPDIDPYSAKQQALDYAELQYKNNIDYIFLANDHIIYFWDFNIEGDATPVPVFFSQDDLIRKRQTKELKNSEPLSQKPVSDDYFSDINSEIKLRPYQIEAFNAIAKEYDNNKRGFLLEMATGTGKTVLSALIISKFLKTNQAQIILFVVDRVELARQTKGSFEKLLGNLSAVATYWGGSKKNLTGANIVVATIQSLIAHGRDVFTSGYFDLIIHDEAHRSIYSAEARGIMEYFVGATRIGLTATPKDFLKNIDINKLNIDDPRAVELRIQKDTYKYFDCESGQATFRYTIQDGVKEGYLVPGKLHKMTSDITQQALSEQGLVGEGDYENENYKITDLEKKVFIPKRNELMMKEFLEYAQKTPDGDIGKTIIFAVNQNHALNLEKVLNNLRPEFNGRFAQTITSQVRDAHELAKDFRNIDNKLPRIAVSVDMLTTGFDAPEVQNVVLCRPVYEPTLYQQIKGRGTRLCKEIDKKEFVLFDFCGVCEYFEEKYDWEAPLKVTEPPANALSKETINQIQPEPTLTQNLSENEHPKNYEKPTITRADFVGGRDEIIYGPNGDKVDREMYQGEWGKAVAKFVETHPEVEQLINNDDKQEELIELINTELLNKSEFYFNEDSLSQSHQVIATIRDFFLSALNKKNLPSHDDQVNEWKNGILDKYGEVKGNGSQQKVMMVKLIIEEAIKNNELRNELKKSPNISFLTKTPFNTFTPEEWINTFGKETLINLMLDVKNSRILNL